jgi:hypothetical protein
VRRLIGHKLRAEFVFPPPLPPFVFILLLIFFIFGRFSFSGLAVMELAVMLVGQIRQRERPYYLLDLLLDLVRIFLRWNKNIVFHFLHLLSLKLNSYK